MLDPSPGPQKRRTKLWLALAAVLVVIALIVVPPYISLNNSKNRITTLVSHALGRPVRLSEVELRLLPRPGFLLTDLTVQEDPAFGAEPVLHANSVKAYIRFSSLWQGKLQISSISVDEASFNLVRMPGGAWNLDSLFRSTAESPGGAGPAHQPPYMEATHSRINIKNGAEKLPFSLLDADASMWRDSDGNWRVRLKGQPARTDVTLDMADTGIVRLEATLHPAAQFNQMPMHVDVDWREAQLGQLTRLLLSSDEGWRGDLTGELHLDGTIDSAKVQARLRASGVHRAEFAPAAPLDFDATCALTLHYKRRGVDGLECNSPVGDGRARVTGNLPGDGQPPQLTLELDRIPAQAGLDLLRTMRSNIDASLQAAGSVSGHMTYDPGAVAAAPEVHKASARAQGRPGPFTGAFTVSGLRVSGDSLSQPLQLANMTLEPAAEQVGQPPALATSVAIPAGGPAPLTVSARLAVHSFSLTVHGTAAIPRLREFVHIAGSPAEQALAALAGEPAGLDLTAEGPWVAPVDVRLTPVPAQAPHSIRVAGTITLREANWKAPFLANVVMIPSATLHIENSAAGAAPGGLLMRWDPVEFSYGPVKGSATLEAADVCTDPDGCPAKFTLRFGALDAAALQAALLGAREKGTLLSTLLDRLKSSAPPAWPDLEGTATADSLGLGPFMLTHVTAAIRARGAGAEATSFNAGLLGGQVYGKAALSDTDKPGYTLEADFSGVNPAQAGELAGMKWSGGAIGGGGKLELAGFADVDLAKSAKGAVHFDWPHGSVAGEGVPGVLAHFDEASGDAAIADGAMTVKPLQVRHGRRTAPVEATIQFGVPAKVTFGASARTGAK